MKQLELLSAPKKEFGGDLKINVKKNCRVLSSKLPIHLVFKSEGLDLFKNRNKISEILVRQIELAQIKLYSYSIQRDHIHLAIHIRNRNSYAKFVRCFSALISRHYGRGAWKLRPYTRVVQWGRDLENLKNYIYKNELEVTGIIPYQLR